MESDREILKDRIAQALERATMDQLLIVVRLCENIVK